MRGGTDYILNDEPCFNLSEVNLQSPMSRGWHRYRILTVVRGDKLVDYWDDMGLAKAFKEEEIRVLGGAEGGNGRIHIMHTVGELIDIANHVKVFGQVDKKELAGVN